MVFKLPDFNCIRMTSETPGKASVLFYQTDEEIESRVRPEHLNEQVEDNVRRIRQKSSLKLKMFSIRSESEDSGVRCNDDEENIRALSGRRKSRVSLYSISSSPAFEISTFDELFQTGGQTRLYLNKAPSILFRQQSNRRQSTIDPPLDSGVRCNDDEENIRALSGRRKSRVSLYSVLSSPAFEISTFDELFQTGGQTRLYLNKAPSILFRQQSNRRQSTIDPPLDSGVRCNDDEENIRALSGRRKCRVSLYSVLSSPAFEISTFDELFQTGGQTRLYLNKAPSILFRQQSNRRQSTIDPPLDSGVRCNDDEENIRALSGRRKSRVSLYSVLSSPAFEISTFDELFQTGGQTRLYLNKAPSSLFRQQSNRRQSTIDPPLEEHSEPDLESEKTETPQESRNEFKRQDSVMSQTLTSLINTSWQGSKGFQEYRHRVGNAVHHKYCMCCRIESTLFIFLYVIFGIFLICTGIMCSLDCGEEFMLTAYLISDGLLSVFLFPTIILGWTNRIGGCFNERESDNNGLFWAVILTLRVIFAGAGTFIVYHRYIQDLPWDNSVCYIEFIILVSTVVIEWSFLLFVILVPLCICGVTFICASSYCADTD